MRLFTCAVCALMLLLPTSALAAGHYSWTEDEAVARLLDSDEMFELGVACTVRLRLIVVNPVRYRIASLRTDCGQGY